VLREAWRLGEMPYETFQRVSDFARIRGDRSRPPKSVDTRRIEKLLAFTRRDETLRGQRDLAILSVLYGAGLRRSELTHLDLAHIEENRLKVFGTLPGSLFLPIHRSGTLRPQRLSAEAVARIVARRAHAAGIGELRPHDLRRALATHLLETGVDILVVQRILGHRSVATVQIYDCRIDTASQAVPPARFY
jgi:site-specific recombinase XerD